MNRTTQYRLLVIILLTAASGFVWWLKGINLGLDLQGGIHLIVQVETSEAMEAEVDQVRERIAGRLTDKEIAFDQVAVTEGLGIEVTGVPDAQDSVARDELEDTINWSLTGSSSDGFRLSMQAPRRAKVCWSSRFVRPERSSRSGLTSTESVNPPLPFTVVAK